MRIPLATAIFNRRYIFLPTTLLIYILIYLNPITIRNSHHVKSNSNLTPPNGTKRFPSCIVIGVRKGGTGALINMIALNSKIKTAKTEVHYFDLDENYKQGPDWYLQRMPYLEDGDIAIEKTPSYFNTPYVPERIRDFNKSISLLLMVRDPVTRLISDYSQILDNHREKGQPYKSFEELALRTDGTVNTMYEAVQKGIYVQYFKSWLHHFPLGQIHIVNGDRFVKKPWLELQKVEKFLKLQPEIKRNQFFFNSTKGFYCLTKGERCLRRTKGRKHPKVSRAAVTILRKFYSKFNFQFYNMVGKDFGWPEE